MRRLLLVLGVLALAVAPAAAAPNDSTNVTDPAVTDGGHPVAVDGVLSVTGWRFQNGRMNVTLRASQYKSVTLSASAETTDQVAQNAYRQAILQRGETRTISIPADRVDGRASVSVTTGACIASGTCPTLKSQDTDVGSPFGGPPTLGWLGGAGIAALSMVGGVLYVVRRGGDEPREAK